MSAGSLGRAGAAGATRVNPYLIAALVSFGTFMEVLDSTALSITLPQIAGALSVSPEESDWVLNAYLVANAAIMPISAWGAERFGRKRFYVACIIAFTVSSLLCGMAWSLETLVLFRVLQGISAAGNAASEAAIIADAFPPEKRGIGFAIYGIAVVVAPTIGPTFGGWVADNYTWRWIFYSNLPIGALAVALSLAFIQDPPGAKARTAQRKRQGWRLDWMGFGLAVVGLGALELFLDKGQQEDWFASTLITTSFVLAVACLLVLPVWELTRRDPILDFRIFANRNFAATFGVMFVTGATLFGGSSILPLMLQQVFQYPATTAGIALTYGGFATMLLMPVAGGLSGRVPTSLLCLTGLSLTAVSLWLMSGLYPAVAFGTIAFYRVVQTMGIAFIFAPLQAQAYDGLKPHQTEQASALINLARNLGGSIGTAVGITVLERRRQYHQSVLSGEATPDEPAYDDWRATAEGLTGGSGESVDALLAQTVTEQANVLAFNDVFTFYFWTVLLFLPLCFLLRGRPGGRA